MIPLHKYYGHLLRILHWCTDQSMTCALEKMDLTAAQGRIMGFLYHCKEPPCPRDVEEAFRLSHPTVSGLLSRLEQKGFIELRTDLNDHRCKRIYIQPKGVECNDLMHKTILDSEERLVQGFTTEEREQFFRFLQRAIINMGAGPSHHHPKEESQK